MIEATGRPDAIPQAIDMVKKGGTILIFSVTNGVVMELQAVKLYQKDIFSHTFSLCDTPQAFDLAINHKSEVMR